MAIPVSTRPISPGSFARVSRGGATAPERHFGCQDAVELRRLQTFLNRLQIEWSTSEDFRAAGYGPLLAFRCPPSLNGDWIYAPFALRAWRIRPGLLYQIHVQLRCVDIWAGSHMAVIDNSAWQPDGLESFLPVIVAPQGLFATSPGRDFRVQFNNLILRR